VPVTSFFDSLFMTLIVGINWSVSSKNLMCGESDVIVLRKTLAPVSDELFRQSNVRSSLEINSAVPHADDMGGVQDLCRLTLRLILYGLGPGWHILLSFFESH
jgi:hypothetical protein